MSKNAHEFKKLLSDTKNLMFQRNSQLIVSPIKAFISYAWEVNEAKDILQRWLAQLRDDLQEAGISVFLDIGDMTGHMEERMRTCLQESDIVLTIHTPRFKVRALDPKTNLGFEYQLTLKKEKDHPGSIIPLHYSGELEEAFPEQLKDCKIHDCRDQNDYEEKLVNPSGILAEIYKIHNQDIAYLSLIKEWRWKKLNKLPVMNFGFIERKEALQRLSDNFFQAIQEQVIIGKSGIGKTILALEFAHNHINEYTIVRWLDGQDLEQEFRRIAIDLAINTENISSLIKEVYHELNHVQRYLLIFDNITDYRNIKDYLPVNKSKHHILVTSRNHDLEWTNVLHLDKFSQEEALSYISQLLPNRDENQIHALIARANYMPLHLTQAITYIRQTGISITRYLRNYPVLEKWPLIESEVRFRNNISSTNQPLKVGLALSPFSKLLAKIKELALNQVMHNNNQFKKVFISYSFSDLKEFQPWIEKLRNHLQQSGLEVVDSQNNEVIAAIRISDAIIIINTPSFIQELTQPQSPLVIEYQKTLEFAKNNPNGIFPLLLKGPSKDAMTLKLRKFLMRDCTKDQDYENLLVAQNPLGIIPAIYKIDIDDNKEYKILLQKWRWRKLRQLPPANPDFVGREAELKQLVDNFQQNSPRQIIIGTGGMGKSELALSFAYTHINNYKIVYWLNTEGDGLEREFKQIGAELGLNINNMQNEELIDTIHKQLEIVPSWLLIFDNVENKSIIKNYLPHQSKSRQHILITSRKGYWKLYKQIELSTFSPDEAKNYILNKLPKIKASEAANLAQVVDYLPLAISQVVSYINQTDISVSNYLERYRIKGVELFKEKDFQAGLTIHTVWALSMEKVRIRSQLAAKMLEACAYLNLDTITLRLFEHKALLGSAIEVDKALIVLRDYSLIYSAKLEDQIRIHRLVQAVSRQEDVRLGVGLLKNIGESFYSLGTELKPHNTGHFVISHFNELLRPQMQVILEHFDRLNSSIQDEEIIALKAIILNLLAYFYTQDGMAPESLKLMEEAKKTCEVLAGIRPIDSIGVIYNKLYDKSPILYKIINNAFTQDKIALPELKLKRICLPELYAVTLYLLGRIWFYNKKAELKDQSEKHLKNSYAVSEEINKRIGVRILHYYLQS